MHPFGVEAYHEVMERTALAADANEGQLSSQQVSDTVGNTELKATKTSYRILLGESDATMSTLQSNSVAWGDVGGEIVDSMGTTLYKAEVLDMGNGQNAAVAIDDYVDEYEEDVED